MKIAVRIETNKDNNIVIKRIDYDRFSFHGFGSFIWKLKPEEVSISQKALDLLKSRIGHEYTSLGDLAGLDLSNNTEAYDKKFRGHNLNYGFLGYELDVPIEDVLIDYDCFELLQKATISNKTLEVDPEDKKRWDEVVALSDAGKEKEANKIVKKFYQREFIPKK